MSHNQTMNPPGRYERGYCSACGQYTERRLMSHIPHLCEECLGFKQYLKTPRGRFEAGNWTDMLDTLHGAASRGKAPFFKPFGKELGP